MANDRSFTAVQDDKKFLCEHVIDTHEAIAGLILGGSVQFAIAALRSQWHGVVAFQTASEYYGYYFAVLLKSGFTTGRSVFLTVPHAEINIITAST